MACPVAGILLHCFALVTSVRDRSEHSVFGTGTQLDAHEVQPMRRGTATFADALVTDVSGDDARHNATGMQHVLRTKADDYKGPKFAVQLVPNDYCSSSKPLCENDDLKKFRVPAVMYYWELSPDGFLNSLDGINGWGAMQDVVVESVTCRKKAPLGLGHDEKLQSYTLSERYGITGEEATQQCSVPLALKIMVATPTWMAYGWRLGAKGFVFWWSGSTMLVGTELGGLDYRRKATRASVFSYRYPINHKFLNDHIIYHAGVVLEWSDRSEVTVFELAWRNTLGRTGANDWLVDDDEKKFRSQLPLAMQAPYDSSKAEIRVYDVGKDMSKLQQYTKDSAKFREPKFPREGEEASVKEEHQAAPDIAQYLLNYMAADSSYVAESRNCQTFARDFFSLLTGETVALPNEKTFKAASAFSALTGKTGAPTTPQIAGFTAMSLVDRENEGSLAPLP